MATRIQEQKEERVVSKPRPAMMKMSSFLATSSSSASSPIASKSPGMPMASGKPNSRKSVEPSSFDAASTSQVRHKDAYLCGLRKSRVRPVASRRRFRRLRQSCGWNLVLQRGICCLAHGASSSVHQESQKNRDATWDHYLHISPNTSHYVEAVFSMVRKIYGRQPGDLMEDLNVNLDIWGMFVNTTLRAAVHLGKDYDTNLHYAKNHLWDSLGQFFLGK